MPVKFIPDTKPAIVLLHKLKSIPDSRAVKTILLLVVATVKRLASPDLIPLN